MGTGHREEGIRRSFTSLVLLFCIVLTFGSTLMFHKLKIEVIQPGKKKIKWKTLQQINALVFQMYAITTLDGGGSSNPGNS